MTVAPVVFTDDQLGFIQQVLGLVDPTGKMHPLTVQIQEAIQVYARAMQAQQPTMPTSGDLRPNRAARRAKK